MASTLQFIFRNVAVSNTAILVRTGSNLLVGWNLINTNTTNSFLKLYNAAAAADVTVGTTAVVRTLLIPASGTVFLSNEDKFQVGFSLGIVAAVVTGIADNNTTAPTIGCYVEILYNENT